ncbi:alanine--tRNA ligase-related protein [Yinghuangia aomiensis]
MTGTTLASPAGGSGPLTTTSGMHPLTPYLLGEPHPEGTARLVDVQRCLRTADLDEVWATPHRRTVFEMLGSWSLGDYGHPHSLRWGHELPARRLRHPARAPARHRLRRRRHPRPGLPRFPAGLGRPGRPGRTDRRRQLVVQRPHGPVQSGLDILARTGGPGGCPPRRPAELPDPRGGRRCGTTSMCAAAPARRRQPRTRSGSRKQPARAWAWNASPRCCKAGNRPAESTCPDHRWMKPGHAAAAVGTSTSRRCAWSPKAALAVTFAARSSRRGRRPAVEHRPRARATPSDPPRPHHAVARRPVAHARRPAARTARPHAGALP